MTPKAKRRGGPPTKAPGGLTEVLFVRVDLDLLAALDVLVDVERLRHPGRGVSRADIVRGLLYDAIKAAQS